MAGANKILKQGQVLFHEGDQSDGMYLVRSGELQIYLEKGGAEVKLATIGPGGMLGEMALFDKKPRSASAKALQESEVTQITNDEFGKLMKQIPKWFVSLMTALSSRLRETNERLQGAENKMTGQGRPMMNLLKVLNVLSLVWHKEGGKEGKQWLLDRDQAEQEVSRILDMKLDQVHKILNALIRCDMISASKNSYKKEVLTLTSRGAMEKFIEFLTEIATLHPESKGLPERGIGLLGAVDTYLKTAAYETATVSFVELSRIGHDQGVPMESWTETMQFFAKFKDNIVLVKATNGMGLRVQKKSFPRTYGHFRLLEELRQSGVL